MKHPARIPSSSTLPFMARANYLREMQHMTFWAFFANLVDGTFSSIIVAKTFHASPLVISLVWSTPLLAHLTTIFWSALVRGRPRIRSFTILAICAIGCILSVAFTPSDPAPWSAWIFTFQIGLARIFLSGIVAVRTSLWAANYPTSHRARIAGRIQMINATILIVNGAVVSQIFDHHPESYRFVYPAIALLGLLSLIPLRRIRVRGERRELQRLRAAEIAAHGQRYSTWETLVRGLRESAQILRTDRRFADYCKAQYFLGSANFMVDPVLTIVLVQKLSMDYAPSTLLAQQIPVLVMLITIRAWASLFDRMGVLYFRVVNSAFWLSSFCSMAVAMFAIHHGAPGWIGVGLIVLSRLLAGVGTGGGAIAWNLGHLHFASKEQAELYMGIHVALTGLRGLVMPFLGTAAYAYLGWASMLISVGFGLGALLLFRRLAQDERRALAALGGGTEG